MLQQRISKAQDLQCSNAQCQVQFAPYLFQNYFFKLLYTIYMMGSAGILESSVSDPTMPKSLVKVN